MPVTTDDFQFTHRTFATVVTPALALQNRIDRRLAEDVPVIPLFELPALLARRQTVRNVVPNTGGDIAWNAEEWWLTR